MLGTQTMGIRRSGMDEGKSKVRKRETGEGVNNVGKIRAPSLAYAGEKMSWGWSRSEELLKKGQVGSMVGKAKILSLGAQDYSFSFVCLKISLFFSTTQIVV